MSWSSWFSEIICPTIWVASIGAVGSCDFNSVINRFRKVVSILSSALLVDPLPALLDTGAVALLDGFCETAAIDILPPELALLSAVQIRISKRPFAIAGGELIAPSSGSFAGTAVEHCGGLGE